ncbi:TetR/AcrR family transcriptional regulator C-terminal domain-containing protein [Planotetraspora phitsanulokensis]|uniref:TetR family transcriptional regulator n=1 Tax=Planotetraspora phitsanulokensis TaxID=575192 RepID=A0A8J3XFD7_9ACTN|nr:TetR/AcrR family transcriptional regulator C-terminal domain-containing protein [Planotetraspora phitsanulokensis]GII39005.1 TetR family transcriptional regulator [Planotetraspora phitsanulokensis]
MSAKPFSSVWTRERKGPRDQGLSRDQIVRAAMELLNEEGLDALSMRKLGARLGAGATSLYWHVANKDELLELVMDEVYDEVVIPEGTSWHDAATAFAYGMHTAVSAHPWCVTLIGVLPGLGPKALTAADRLMAAFSDAGFDGPDVDYAVAAVVSYTLGATIPEVAYLNALARAGTDVTGAQAVMEPIIHEVAADYPHLIDRYRTYAGTSIDPLTARRLAFDFGLVALLDGLAARLPREARLDHPVRD